MGAGLCSCHRAPPRYRLGPNIYADDQCSPYYALPYEKVPLRRQVHDRIPVIYARPPLTMITTSQQRASNTSDFSNMINIALLESSEGSVQGSELSSTESSSTLAAAGERRPLLVSSASSPLGEAFPSGRRKPPPKPPRLRSYVNQSSTCSPTPSIRSVGSESLKSSLADVTNALDLSIQSSSLDDTALPSGTGSSGDGFSRLGQRKVFHTKVYRIIAQARDFLVCELDAERLLPYLVEHEVVDRATVRQLLQSNYSKVVLCEQLLDTLTHKGPREFRVFCDAVRLVGKQTYIADLLQVLDSLIETIAMSSVASSTATAGDVGGTASRTDPGYDSMEGHLNGAALPPTCPQCAAGGSNNNAGDDLLGESPSFDVDMSYLDVVTGEVKALHDVTTIKIDRPLTPRGFNRSFSFQAEDADRYLPVLTVSLFHQCLAEEGLCAIADILERYTCVRELSISKCHMTARWTGRLARAVARNRSLVKLDLRFNSLDSEDARALAAGLKQNCTLRSLNLAGTELSGPGCSALAAGLTAMPLLSELDVGFNDLQDTGCKAIASCLASSSNLRKLRMRDNYISAYGSNALFKALKKNSRLTVLDLSSNKISDSCLPNMAEMLLSNRTLREVNLENCGVTAAGCVALARALKTNSTMRLLDLSMNPLGNAGVRGLSDGLKYNHVIDTLCLNMCRVGNRGFLDILEALRYNTSMTTLKLCYNDIGRSRQEVATLTSPLGAPSAALRQNENDIDEELPAIDVVYEQLCQILQFNKNLKVLLWGNKLDGPGDSD